MQHNVDALLAELREHFRVVNVQKFGGILPEATITVNPRLRALTGRILYDELLIEMSLYHLVQPYGRDQAFKTLEHEMLHLYLDTLGEPPGHTHRFKRLAAELDIPVWHGLPYPRNRKGVVIHVYECPACTRRIERNRRLSDKQRSACGDCCRAHNGGRFDERFVMRYISTHTPQPQPVPVKEAPAQQPQQPAYAMASSSM